MEARNQNAKARIAMMVGTTIVSMMKTESTKMVLLAAATGPCGSSRFIGKPLAVGSPGKQPNVGKGSATNAIA
ncbi:hypothetical protein GCM10010987_13600 [Bradyrhizobium guangdongense]|uniref:Uncharacterized protein n=1 Tax=Bradyrhizobium guangdongense TaxID=1325090 RepID=A0AA87W1V2_9BRAD|nr:hypothetical protein GCM10010987_13600 [Bradyrhizobium guangdongense]